MVELRIGQAARVLGISADSIRRLADAGTLSSTRTKGGHRLVDGADLARLAESGEVTGDSESSARNRLLGLVTRVQCDGVAAQVEMRCGPFRLVSLLTREAVESLGLEPGVLVHAVVKATNVVVELAGPRPARTEGDEPASPGQ